MVIYSAVQVRPFFSTWLFPLLFVHELSFMKRACVTWRLELIHCSGSLYCVCCSFSRPKYGCRMMKICLNLAAVGARIFIESNRCLPVKKKKNAFRWCSDAPFVWELILNLCYTLSALCTNLTICMLWSKYLTRGEKWKVIDTVKVFHYGGISTFPPQVLRRDMRTYSCC